MKSEVVVHWWDGMGRNQIVDELIAYLSSDFCGTDYDKIMGAFDALRDDKDTTTASWYSKNLYCDACGGRIIGEKYNYCPMCGRKLEAEE